MEMLNYDQTLELVELFMKKSGIRSYCANVCRGHCCGSCYTENPEACYRNEGRRLACSLYLCDTSVFPSVNFIKPFMKIYRGIMKAIDKVYAKAATDQHTFSSGFSIYRSKYFKVPPKELFSDFEISKAFIVDNLTPKFTAEVKECIDTIIEYIGSHKGKKGIHPRLSWFKLKRKRGKLHVHDRWKAYK